VSDLHGLSILGRNGFEWGMKISRVSWIALHWTPDGVERGIRDLSRLGQYLYHCTDLVVSNDGYDI
jgi:hypothetical protein